MKSTTDSEEPRTVKPKTLTDEPSLPKLWSESPPVKWAKFKTDKVDPRRVIP